MRSEDLTSLFTSPDAALPVAPGLATTRQGTILTFDTVTGENTIQIGSEVMTDLPVDSVGAVPLAAGDVVQIDTSTPSWFIKGRVSDPGAGAVPTWTADIDQAQSSANQASADAAAAQAAADALQDDIDAAAAAVAVVEASLATLNGTTLPALEAALDAAVADVAAATASLATLTTTTLPALAADLAAAEADISTAQGDITTAQADITAAQADVTAVEGTVSTLTTTTIPALQAEVDDILPIVTTDITDDAITTPKIATNAITAGKIQADAVTAAKILAGAVTTAKLDAGAVTAAKITAGTITATELAAGAITTVKLAAGAVTANELAAGSVTALKIAADTITAAQIAAGAVTASELAASAVTAGKIAAGTIVAADISSGAITTAKIAADAVTANEIAAGAITATEIAAGAITGAKLTADAIDGKTITGATIKTAAINGRWELSSINSNELLGYPDDNLNNPAPGVIKVDSTSIGVSGWMYETRLTAPYSAASGGGSGNPLLRLVAHEGTARTAAELIGEQGAMLSPARDLGVIWDDDTGEVSLIAPTLAGVQANNVPVVTTTATQTLTNKTLGGAKLGAAGSAITALRFGQVTANTAGASQVVVTHSLGGTPVAILFGDSNQHVRAQAWTSTNFTVEVRSLATGAVVGNGVSVTFFWLALL